MAVEELFFFKNNKTVISVSEARGVILLAGQNKDYLFLVTLRFK
jgi:crossover junction endodeoxyribonuclease RuvC